MDEVKSAPMNGVWKWSDIEQTRDKEKHLPCWGAVSVNGGPWIENPNIGENPSIGKREDAK